jgi:hypothetical protein
LQEISEEMRSRCPQRKRSSSLPVPKIEVSLCSEGKTKDSPKGEFYRSEDGTSFDINSAFLGKLLLLLMKRKRRMLTRHFA